MTGHTTDTPKQNLSLTVDSINGILKQVNNHHTVTLLTTDGWEYDIEWNIMANEPQIIEPGTTQIRIRGEEAVKVWLEKRHDIIDWYIQNV